MTTKGHRVRYRLIGNGVYTVAEAARLASVPTDRVSRWTRGYWYQYRGERRFSPPIVGVGVQGGDRTKPIISFGDLIEIRFLEAFREHGVAWKTIRLAAARARDLLDRSHPFATKIFRTDGRHILADVMADEISADRRLFDLVNDQLEWEHFVHPHLAPAEIEFVDDSPRRWWPLGPSREVVVDPQRAFGAPIVHREGIQTYILARAVAVEGDTSLVAHWYDVSREAVEDAVEFEGRLRRAA